jgi:hypothetical protein
MRTLEDLKNDGRQEITRKTISRYLEITFVALIIGAIVQGITSDWRLAFPCFIVGLYWFITHSHNNKLIVGFAVYAFIVAVLLFYFEKGSIEQIDCTFADDYLECLESNAPTFIKVLNIQSLLWIFCGFLVYMNQQYKKK